MSGPNKQRQRAVRAAERDSLAQVLTLVRSGQARTRQKVERASGLGRAVVSDRVATLLKQGLVSEEGLDASTGGRAPRRLRFNASAGYALAASLGATTLGVGLTDLSGRLLIEHHEPADVTRGADVTVSRVIELFDWVLGEYPVPGNAWAISLALPGYVGAPGGQTGAGVTLNLVPGWAGHAVRERLSSRFDAPVFIGNEVHLMALGELRADPGMGQADLLFVKVGTGISVGLCSKGRIHSGWMGFAGDIGHVAVTDTQDIVCRCGNRGCLEALAAGPAIARAGGAAAATGDSQYLARLLESGTTITASHVGAGADNGDPYCTELLVRSGRLVGGALATLVVGYNPAIVVVGGGVAQSGRVFINAVRDGISMRTRSVTTENLAVVQSEHGKTAGLIGGAYAALDALFEREYLASWIMHGDPRGYSRSTSVAENEGSGGVVSAQLSPVAPGSGNREAIVGLPPGFGGARTSRP